MSLNLGLYGMHLATMLDSDSLLDQSHKAGIEEGDLSEPELEVQTKSSHDFGTLGADDPQEPGVSLRSVGRQSVLASKSSALGVDDDDLQLHGKLASTLHMGLI
jgi:hypothetical protein